MKCVNIGSSDLELSHTVFVKKKGLDKFKYKLFLYNACYRAYIN